MNMFDEYFKLQEKIFAYFGYVEDWRIIPLSDCRKFFWRLTGETSGDSVYFGDTREDALESTDTYYGYAIYTQRFLPKWVYRAEEYTLVVADTQCDGNKLLCIFDNSKEVK